MSKLSVRTREEAESSPLPAAYSGRAVSAAYFAGDRHPLHLHLVEIARGETLQIKSVATDQLAYV